MRRQLVLLALLAGVAYLWWQSRTPSRYSEWATHMAGMAMDTTLEKPLEGPDVEYWTFVGKGDSTWQVSHSHQGLERYRVDLLCRDSLLWRLFVNLDMEGHLLTLSLRSRDKQVQVVSAGDSARFISRTDSMRTSWIPWSPQALLYQSIPALCDRWHPGLKEEGVTLVRIHPESEVVVQLPAVLSTNPDGDVLLSASGKEIVHVHYSDGRAVQVCEASGRCLDRHAWDGKSGTP